MSHPSTHPPRRLVLTGGPGAGKSTIAAAVAAAHPGTFVMVPEAARQVYERLNTTWPQLDLPGRYAAQRQMYELQVEQEARLLAAHPGKVLLLDRGTIDGAAYWPDGAAAFWPAVGTTHAAELARYDAVIWLQTGAALGLYDGDASNPIRFERPEAAVESGNVLTALWGDHPRFTRVSAYRQFEEKVREVQTALLRMAAQG